MRAVCRHGKGRWARSPLELAPWQWSDVVAPMFGWLRPDGTRRFRSGYIEVPKKNGKSTLLSGLGLLLLVGDGEDGPEVYTAGFAMQQASIIFGESERMVRRSPELARVIRSYPSTHRLVCAKNEGVYMALSKESALHEGLNAHAILFDELHTQRTRALWDVLLDAGSARRQPVHLSITTAGVDKESICWEQHQIARAILDGEHDDPYTLAVIYGAKSDEDWTQPEAWRRANPSIGITIDEENLREAAEKAKLSSSARMGFLRRRLNIWTQAEVQWLDVQRWDALLDRDVNPETLKGRPCYAGLDLASTTDLTALVLVFPRDSGGADLLADFWVPEGALQREAIQGERYRRWALDGWLHLTPGEVTDYELVEARIAEIRALYDLREVAIDRFNATMLGTRLDGAGVRVVLHGQGYVSMSGPAKEFERAVLQGTLRHDGNPVLRWNVSNCGIEQDAAGNIKPSRRDSRGKIDGVVAALMGYGRSFSSPAIKRSVYEERGLA